MQCVGGAGLSAPTAPTPRTCGHGDPAMLRGTHLVPVGGVRLPGAVSSHLQAGGARIPHGSARSSPAGHTPHLAKAERATSWRQRPPRPDRPRAPRALALEERLRAVPWLPRGREGGRHSGCSAGLLPGLLRPADVLGRPRWVRSRPPSPFPQGCQGPGATHISRAPPLCSGCGGTGASSGQSQKAGRLPGGGRLIAG